MREIVNARTISKKLSTMAGDYKGYKRFVASRFGDGYRYLLTVIDTFSKCAWGETLKSKSLKPLRTIYLNK